MDIKYVVFLPVRNGERYLAEALDSIFGQTRKDWRLCVLENQSTDATASILAKMNHPSMDVVPAASSLSITDNWARIRDYISTRSLGDKLCTTIGHDDVLSPTFLQTIDDLATRDPAATLYQTLFNLIDSDGRQIRMCRPVPECESATDFISARCWGLRDSWGTGYVFRGREYLEVGGIPPLPRLLYADDLLFARLARLGHKSCAQSVEFSYRLHRASASSSHSSELYAEGQGGLSRYVSTLEGEWADFASSPRGSAALAALIARETMIFTCQPLKRLLPRELRQHVEALATVFEKKAGGLPFTRWLGSNWVSRAGYIAVKSVFLCALFAADRISRVLRGPKRRPA